MRSLTRRVLALIAAAAVLTGLLVPAMAYADSPPADEPPAADLRAAPATSLWEPDETTATARNVPLVSLHAFETTSDVDWTRIHAETTGTPFVLETQYVSGASDAEMAVYDRDGNQLAANNDSPVWTSSLGATLYFTAPAPGTYFVKVSQHVPSLGGVYVLYEYRGIARRVFGRSRFRTAVEASRLMYPDAANPLAGVAASPDSVVVADGWNFPDGLASSVLANNRKVPLLLVTKNAIPPETAEEIQRLGAARASNGATFTVIIAGGQGAVSDAVADAIGRIPHVTDTIRLGGASRFGTAERIAAFEATTTGVGDTAFVVTAWDFADALSATPVAAAHHAPILLSHWWNVPDSTLQALRDLHVSKIVVIGSRKVVSDHAATQLASIVGAGNVTRIGGANRYDTARQIAQFGVDTYGMNAHSMLLASGEPGKFPDGLAAAPLSAFTGGPLLLTHTGALSPEVVAYYDANKPMTSASYMMGGGMAISYTTTGPDFRALFLR